MVLRASYTTVVFFLLLIGAHECANTRRRSIDNGWTEFDKFLQWRRTRNQENEMKTDVVQESFNQGGIFDGEVNNEEDHRQALLSGRSIAGAVDQPPPVDQPALMGRYIVNQADWTSVATISSRKDIFSFPIANLVSVSDGPLGNGTGIPYMFLTPLDYTAQDLALDDRATLLMSLAQGSYCTDKDMDPMDPRCARIILAGRIHEVGKSSPEHEVAKSAVFGRHPWLADMPPDHRFFFAKLNIASVAVLDTFGGPKYVSVEDYMHPPSPQIHRPIHPQELYETNRRNEKSRFEDSDETRAVYRV